MLNPKSEIPALPAGRQNPKQIQNPKPKIKTEKGKVAAISVSENKGIKKRNIPEAELIQDLGIKGDAHAEGGIRQISLLAQESIEKIRKKGLNVKPGDFAENITTQGIDLLKLPVGTQIKIGETSLLEISQHGKTCHSRCAIYYAAGDCVMPKEGVFARVIKGGRIKAGDTIHI